MASTVIAFEALDGTDGFVVNPVGLRTKLGESVANVGDLNGDGFADFVVGAINGSPGGVTEAGESFVVFGKAAAFNAQFDLATLDGSDGFRIDGIDSGDHSGYAASGLGDVNGDGFADLIIGSQSGGPPGEDRYGESYVIFGKASGFAASIAAADLDGADGFRLNGIDDEDYAGRAVSGAGDINGDGFEDIVVGAYLAYEGYTNRSGQTYIVFGQSAAFNASIDLGALDGGDGFLINGRGFVHYLGFDVSSAGDFNGDGVEDLLVGAPKAYGGGFENGESYVIFGQTVGFGASFDLTSLDGANGFRIDGAAGGNRAGTAVSEAGDVNGDGLADILVGAANGNGYRGESYVVFGKSTGNTATLQLSALDGSDGFAIQGTDSGEFAGREVSQAGDANGDGFDDVLVSAYKADVNGYSRAGQSFLIFGKAAGFAAALDYTALDSTEGARIDGPEDNDAFFGEALSGGGDINGDGFDDLIVGAYYADLPGGTYSGQVSVIFGFDSGAVTDQGTAGADTLDGSVGVEVMVGGQGDDVLIGGGGADVLRGGSGADILSVADNAFQRADGGLGTDTLRLAGAGQEIDFTAVGDQKTRSIEAIDLAGAGAGVTLSRLSVLALSEETNGLAITGDATTSLTLNDGVWSQAVIDGATNSLTKGEAVITIANTVQVNALIAGQPLEISLADLDGTDGFKLNGIDSGDGAGTATTGVGDLNGDGFSDLLIGAPGGDPGGNADAGEAYIVFGKAAGFSAALDLNGISGADGAVINGIAANDLTGGSVARAGDFNGDGVADALVGAESAGGAGAAFVLYGEQTFAAPASFADLDGSDGFRIDGVDPNDATGRGLGSAGDVNGDGIDDLIIGADGGDAAAADAGEVYVVFGGADVQTGTLDLATLDATEGFRLDGPAAGDQAGFAVEGAGDVNGDGVGDLIIGALYSDPGANADAGESYIVFGTVGGLAGPVDLSALDGADGFSLTGAAAGDNAGVDVASAGDVNGDGFADFLIGARYADPGAVSNAGSGFLVFGGAGAFAASIDLAALDGTDGVRLDGVAADDNAGQTLKGLGDVNADGFDDFIVTARLADDGGDANAGAAYVVFGKAAGFAASVDLAALTLTDGFQLTGIDADDQAGFSAGRAGDVNGDGFADIIIGAPQADVGAASKAGESYVVFGFDSGGVTDLGSDAADSLAGDAGANVMVGGLGNDVLAGAGGLDALTGGGGDDVLDVADAGFQRVAGGSGTDTLRISGAGITVDLSAAGDQKVSGVEAFALTGAGSGVTLTGLAVLALSDTSNTVTITGTAAETLTLADANWVFDSLQETTQTFTNGGATIIADQALTTTSVTPFAPVAVDDAYQMVIGETLNDDVTPTTPGQDNDPDAADVTVSHVNGIAIGGGAIALASGATVTMAADGSFTFDRSGDPTDVNAGQKLTETFTYTLTDAGALTSTATATIEVFGNTSALDGADGLRITGADPGDNSGRSVNILGDVNADGFDDLIIGGSVSESHVVFGQAGGFSADLSLADLDGGNGFRIDGIDVNDLTGYASGRAGDVNGDGFDDIIVGGRNADGGGTYNAGESYVVFGKAAGFTATLAVADLDGADGFRISGIDASDSSGISVGGVGDFNGDGVDDVIIGAYGGDPGGNSFAGESYVVFGNSSGFGASVDLDALDGGDGFRLDGIDVYDTSGRTVNAAGDVNGDGFADLIIGAPGANPGEAYVVFGASGGFASALDLGGLDGSDGFRMDGFASNSLSVAGAGDINGDGIADIVIGAEQAGPNTAGENFVVFGTASGFAAAIDLGALDGTDGFRVGGLDPYDYTGVEARGAGDFNGDGFGDLLLGARYGDLGGQNTGEGYVIFGKATAFGATFDLEAFDGTDGMIIAGDKPGANFGDALAGGGDIDGDGFDDILLGGFYGGPSYQGQAAAVFGYSSGAVTIQGSAGVDAETGTAGADIIVLGRGADTFDALDGADVVRGGEGDDVGVLGAGADRGFGGSGDDVIDGGIGNDLLQGDAGDDTLTIGTGDDIAFGGSGDDTIRISADDLTANDRIDGGTGTNDRAVLLTAGAIDFTAPALVAGIERIEMAVGGTVTAHDANLTWIGRGGNETFTLGGGVDSVSAGAGNDQVDGGGDADVINGQTGDDVLNGQAGDDVLIGGAGVDTLDGGIGADQMFGGAGADTYFVDDAGDTISDTGADIDTVNSSLTFALAGNLENLTLTGAGVINGTGNGQVNILTGNDQANVLTAGGGGDTLNGGGGTDTLNGQDGDDQIDGGADADILMGQGGADTLDGGAGADQLHGGFGGDTYGVDDAGDVITEVGLDVDTVESLIALTLAPRIENLTFLGAADLNGVGNSLDNVMIGNSGANDLTSGGGADTLDGGGGDDLLYGQGDNDRITGGAGIDQIRGDGGSDVFVFNAGLERDVIYDYQDGADRFDVISFGFTNFAAELQPLISTVNGHAVIDFSATDRVILIGQAEGALDATDFILS